MAKNGGPFENAGLSIQKEERMVLWLEEITTYLSRQFKSLRTSRQLIKRLLHQSKLGPYYIICLNFRAALTVKKWKNIE